MSIDTYPLCGSNSVYDCVHVYMYIVVHTAMQYDSTNLSEAIIPAD